MRQPTPDKLIRIDAVAELLSLDVETIYAGKAKTGELLRIKPSENVLLFSHADVQAWIARRVAEAKAERAQLLPVKAKRLALVGPAKLSRRAAQKLRIIAAQRAPLP